MKLGMPYALNEIGGRSNQEDSIYPAKGEANESARLFLVCDGMGGHENGEVASGLVCSTFAANLANIDHEEFTVDMFNYALNAAYDALDREDPNPESMRKMGTTLTFMHLNDHEVVVAHMGDSRVYHVRPSERNPILYQSSDHSLVNELVRAEIITPEEALTHPRRNVITRAMQPRLETRHNADVRTFSDVMAGDYFFLCSDGITETITNDILVDILRRDVSDAEKIEAIRALCAELSRDNFSAYLVPIAEGLPPVVHDVVSAELVEDVNTQIVEEASDEDKTMPPIYANDQNKEGNRRTRFTPMNIGLAVVVLIAVCLVIWFVVGNVDVNDDGKQYPESQPAVANSPIENIDERDPADANLLDGPQAVVEPMAVPLKTLTSGMGN